MKSLSKFVNESVNEYPFTDYLKQGSELAVVLSHLTAKKNSKEYKKFQEIVDSARGKKALSDDDFKGLLSSSLYKELKDIAKHYGDLN